MTDNQIRRKIKLEYEERRNKLENDFQCRQDVLDSEIERLRTDISYHSHLMRNGDEGARLKALELGNQLSELRSAKTRLDYERRCAIVALKRERAEQLLQYETTRSERKEACHE